MTHGHGQQCGITVGAEVWDVSRRAKGDKLGNYKRITEKMIKNERKLLLIT